MRVKRLLALGAACAVLVVGFALRHGAAQDAGPTPVDAGATAPAPVMKPVPGASAKPQTVTVGAFLRNVESIDLQNNSYFLNAIIWFKWKGPIDPIKTLRFSNVIEASGLYLQPQFPEPIDVDGFKYQQIHVEGKFFHKFWLGTFPLDWQRVTLQLEDGHYSTNELVYLTDEKDSGVSKYLRIPGWRIVEVTNQRWDTEHASDYGLGSVSLGRTRPGLRFGLRIERPMRFFFFKIIPPILVTLACCIMVFLLRPSYVDARVGTPIAGLLTAVFLQLTFTGNLPNVGIMLLIDHIFNFSYVVIFAVLMVCMLSARMFEQATELAEADGDNAAEIEDLNLRMKRLDRRAILILPIGYVVGIIMVTIIVRGSYFFEMMFR